MKIITVITFALIPGVCRGFSNLFNTRPTNARSRSITPGVPKIQRGLHYLQPRNGRSSTQQQNMILSNMILLAVPILDNWTITTRGEASGVVKNHPDPNIFDGELLTTSKLDTLREQAKEGMTVVTASGSRYKLGKARGAAEAPAKFGWGSFSMSSSKPKNNKAGWGGSRVPVLDNWTVTVRGEIKGTVSNHPNSAIANGDVITTSKVVEDRNSLNVGMSISTSSGSNYLLGKKKPGMNLFSGTTTPSALSKGGTFASGSNNLQEAYNPSPAPTPAPSKGFGETFEMFGKSMSRAVEDASASFSIANKKSAAVLVPTTRDRAASNALNIKENAIRIANLRDLKLKYGVNGKTVGNGKYLLCDKPQRSTSGKSNIWSAYRAGKDGLPVGDKLTIKISINFDAISREADNYNRVCSGLFPGRFVEKAEFLPETNGNPAGEFKSSCALVIESGRKDLKAILAERGGRGFEGKAMRDAASAALQCIQAMHSSGIVWTDLKTENFVIVSEEIGDNGNLPGVKGIDLESAMPRRQNPVDFSPEACPPEFAEAFISGEGLSFKLEYSYDIWSYGMMLYELTTGRAYFGNKTPAQITKSLQYSTFEADVSLVTDPKLRDFIIQCLQADPKKRPGVNQLLLHPYFLTSGLGPFGW